MGFRQITVITLVVVVQGSFVGRQRAFGFIHWCARLNSSMALNHKTCRADFVSRLLLSKPKDAETDRALVKKFTTSLVKTPLVRSSVQWLKQWDGGCTSLRWVSSQRLAGLSPREGWGVLISSWCPAGGRSRAAAALCWKGFQASKWNASWMPPYGGFSGQV